MTDFKDQGEAVADLKDKIANQIVLVIEAVRDGDWEDGANRAVNEILNLLAAAAAPTQGTTPPPSADKSGDA